MIPGGRAVDFAAQALFVSIPLAYLAGIAVGAGWLFLGLLLAAFPAFVFVQLWRGK